MVPRGAWEAIFVVPTGDFDFSRPPKIKMATRRCDGPVP